MIDPYFNRPEVSNSDLTKTKQALSTRDSFDPTDAYAFGTLIDAMITEPDRIDWWRKLIDGQPLYGIASEKSTQDFDTAKKMFRVFSDDKKAQAIIKNASFQKVSIRNRSFNWNSLEFNMDCRCKWDFFGNISGDIKSTVATTQKQFVAACHYFDYFRSRAWYMDLEDTTRDIIIGISKKNLKIFFVPIVRGDELYELGKQEYEELAFKHWVLN